MHTQDLLILLLLIAAATTTVRLKKLTPPAAGTGAVLGALIYGGSGFMGLTLLVVFFMAGTAATSWKKKDKLAIKGSAAHQSTRHPGQVLANAGVAAFLSVLAFFVPVHKPLFLLMMAAAMSSAMADTLSSELGMLYGRRCFHVLSWKTDQRGLDGVVSIEGMLIGFAGSILIAGIYTAFTTGGPKGLFFILIAGTFGNLADSVLGAIFERRGLLSNDLVNFLNTLVAAVCAGALVFISR